MPAQRAQRPAVRDQIVDHHTDNIDAADRLLSEVTRRLALQDQASRAQQTVDLALGTNRITHNLGRKPKHVTLMPTTADATFAWSVSEITDRQLVITVVGVAQTGASIEVS